MEQSGYMNSQQYADAGQPYPIPQDAGLEQSLPRRSPTVGSASTDSVVNQGVHQELLNKHRRLQNSFDELHKKYGKLKDRYAQEKANHESIERKLRTKIKSLEGVKVSTATLPHEKKKGSNIDEHDGDGEEDENGIKKRKLSTIEVETPSGQTTEKLKARASSDNAFKAERDTYKAAVEKANSKLKEMQAEKKKQVEFNIDLKKDVDKYKALIEKVEGEKAEILEKYEVLRAQTDAMSPVGASGSPAVTDDEANSVALIMPDEARSKKLFKRKEYYKSKYTALLEEQNREQRAYILTNKLLLEKYVLPK